MSHSATTTFPRHLFTPKKCSKNVDLFPETDSHLLAQIPIATKIQSFEKSVPNGSFRRRSRDAALRHHSDTAIVILIFSTHGVGLVFVGPNDWLLRNESATTTLKGAFKLMCIKIVSQSYIFFRPIDYPCNENSKQNKKYMDRRKMY